MTELLGVKYLSDVADTSSEYDEMQWWWGEQLWYDSCNTPILSKVKLKNPNRFAILWGI